MTKHEGDETVTLTFRGTPYDGAWVRVRLKAPDSMVKQAERLRESRDLRTAVATVEAFATHQLVAWNLEDAGGRPVPADVEGWAAIPLDLASQIVKAWFRVVTDTVAKEAKQLGLRPR